MKNVLDGIWRFCNPSTLRAWNVLGRRQKKESADRIERKRQERLARQAARDAGCR